MDESELNLRIADFLQEFGNDLSRKSVGELFPDDKHMPRQAAIYCAQDVHAFYRIESEPGYALYVRGHHDASTDRYVGISAKLIPEIERFRVGHDIHRIRWDYGVVDTLEAQFDRFNDWNSETDVVMHPLPYRLIDLEKIIFEKIFHLERRFTLHGGKSQFPSVMSR